MGSSEHQWWHLIYNAENFVLRFSQLRDIQCFQIHLITSILFERLNLTECILVHQFSPSLICIFLTVDTWI